MKQENLVWLIVVSGILMAVLWGCSDDEEVIVTLSGEVFPFNVDHEARVEGAKVWILEYPDKEVITGGDGRFQFDGLKEGESFSLVMDHPDYAPIQTGVFTVGTDDIERVTFQAVTHDVYDYLSSDILNIVPEEDKCQMVTTVTRVGKSLYDDGAHGEAGVTVTLDPPLPPEHGPIYFNSLVIPSRGLTETSDDGGVLFIQVPEGEYTWTAHKEGVRFRQVRMTCRAGVLINASPPWGLQVLE